MSNPAANLPHNYLILTGAEFCARYEPALLAYDERAKANTDEWFLALQVWQGEKAYVKACEERYEVLYEEAFNRAQREVLPTFSFWARLNWRLKGCSLLYHPQVLRRRDELLEAALAAEHIDEYVLDEYVKPPKLHHAFQDSTHPCYAPALALLKQAKVAPEDTFAVAFDVVNFLTQPEEQQA